MKPSSIACFIAGSTMFAEPAPTTMVYPCSKALVRLRLAISAWYAGGKSNPNGVKARLFFIVPAYVEW